jgi:hypothetical protein
MAQRDTLEESLRHLEYEMAIMVATPRMLAQHNLTPAMNTARPDGYYWCSDRAVAYLAAMESSLVHARLLDDFYRHATADVPTTGIKANDRYAAQYCVNEGWSGFPVLTEDEHAVIDRQLSHFTTLRRPRSTHAVGQFAQTAIDALTELTRQADTQWTDRLQAILTRSEAEWKRGTEPWNPL